MTAAGARSAHTLYGVEGSYYAAKIRSYLSAKGIPFIEIQADRKAFNEVILPRVGYAVVPVLLTPDGETLQDTAAMVDVLEQRYPAPALVPASPGRCMATRLLEFYADEWLKLPALYYRWHYDSAFAIDMMGRNNDPDRPPADQRRVGARIASLFQSWPEHLGANESTHAAVEAGLLEFLRVLEVHFGAHAFVLGDAPTLGDCALAGPMYAHLYHDPYSGRLLREQAPLVCDWVKRMRGITAVQPDASSAADEVPETIAAALRLLSADFVPVLQTAIPQLQAWLEEHPDAPVPRYAGEHTYTLGRGRPYAADGVRSVHPFEQWKLQRVLDAAAVFTGAERAEAERTLDMLGASELLQIALPRRLARRDFQLVREPV